MTCRTFQRHGNSWRLSPPPEVEEDFSTTGEMCLTQTLILRTPKSLAGTPMNYSYARDGADPFHDGKTRGRIAWINEATRLLRVNDVDPSRFYGIIAIFNANVERF